MMKLIMLALLGYALSGRKGRFELTYPGRLPTMDALKRVDYEPDLGGKSSTTAPGPQAPPSITTNPTAVTGGTTTGTFGGGAWD